MALYGYDISAWQGVGAGDNAKDFVIVKATGSDAGNYVDSKCDQHYQRAKSQGKLLGVYHFADPTKGSAESQAEFFVKNIKGYIGEAILVLDWEKDTRNVAWAKAWLDKVQALTGVKPLIYMSASVITANNWASVANADYGLWVAGYPGKYNVKNPPVPSVKDMPYKTGAWKTWAIWQYSSSAGTLDLDIANMDTDAWKKYAAKSGSKPTPTPTPTPSKSFFPAKGYWTLGDQDKRIGQEAAFLRKNFPAYTPAAALGNYYGRNLFGAVKQFQRRTGLVADGSTGPKTLNKLEQFGFCW